MKRKRLTTALFAAAQICTTTFATAQTASDSAAPPMIPPGRPPFGRPDLSDFLTRVLILTDPQKIQVQRYLDVMQPQFDAIHQQARASHDALLRELNASIRPLLTTDQQSRLDALEAMRGVVPPFDPIGAELIFGNSFGPKAQ